MPTRLNVDAMKTPTPYGILPSPRQRLWHSLEYYGFIHYTVNAFTDKEWGYGDESPAVFNPTTFDADQIVRAAKDGGMKGLILTCKHHDGFCLWPSQYTEHSVKNSPWKQGRGDMVREISDACRKHGLQFGVYLSPWDRNHKDYGRPEYITYYRNQLRELLTNYGRLFEVWFDGANGGDGYYGGAKETRKIDASTYYEWPETWRIVRELQPDACMFSDGGPDIRWVGNEQGFANDPCWHRINAEGFAPGVAKAELLGVGNAEGTHWMPAECDVSIRPGWFYHANEDDKVRSPQNLLDLYFRSVGRGASLLLNLPPDRRGLVHENDVASMKDFKRALDALFAVDLAQGATASASSVRGGDSAFGAANVLDGNRETYWATDDGVLSAELVLAFPRAVTFRVVSLREYLPLGQRVRAFALDAWSDGAWKELAAASAIGNRRLLRVPATTATKLRLRVVDAVACPAISEFAAYEGAGLPS